MARTIQVEISCDLCSTPVPEGSDGIGTQVGLDVWYTVDLCEEHRKQLVDFLDPYFTAGTLFRPVGQKPKKSNKSKELEKVRNWAETHGIEVSKRGRVAQSTIDAYEASQAQAVIRSQPVYDASDAEWEAAGRNPAEAVSFTDPATDTVKTISLSDLNPESANPFDVDMMAGTGAPQDGPIDVSPVKGKKAAPTVTGTRNPDGTPVGQ